MKPAKGGGKLGKKRIVVRGRGEKKNKKEYLRSSTHKKKKNSSARIFILSQLTKS